MRFAQLGVISAVHVSVVTKVTHQLCTTNRSFYIYTCKVRPTPRDRTLEPERNEFDVEPFLVRCRCRFSPSLLPAMNVWTLRQNLGPAVIITWRSRVYISRETNLATCQHIVTKQTVNLFCSGNFPENLQI